MGKFFTLAFLLVFLSSISSFELDVDFDEEECSGDACFKRRATLLDDTEWLDEKSGLKYHQPRFFYVDTRDLIKTITKKDDTKVIADSFKSCKGKMLADVCTFSKRGWLQVREGKEVISNKDALLGSFSELEGAESAIKTCLKVAEDPVYGDDDYYYDYYDYYEDYYDPYDYRMKRDVWKMESRGRRAVRDEKYIESDLVRVRRQDGKKKKNKGVRSGPDTGKKVAKGASKKGNGPKPGTKVVRKGGAVKGVSGKGKGVKGGKGENVSARKFVKQKDGKPPAKVPEKQKIENRLAQLGLPVMPSKSVLDEMMCVEEEIRSLIKARGEEILSNVP